MFSDRPLRARASKVRPRPRFGGARREPNLCELSIRKARHLDTPPLACGAGARMRLAITEDVAYALILGDQVVNCEPPIGRTGAEHPLHVLVARQVPRSNVAMD